MGIVYTDDLVTVIQGTAQHFIKRAGPYDHCITDPPYDQQTADGARSSSGRDLAPWVLTDQQLRGIWGKLGEVVSRWIIATMSIQQAAALERKPPAGVRVLRLGVWDKPNGRPQITGDRPAQGWECVCICHSDRSGPSWNGGGSRAVWRVPTITNSEHVNEKPAALIRQWVEQFTDPGDKIVDPFAGSGVVGQVALELGRRAVLIERDPASIELIIKRLALTRQAMRQGELFPREKGGPLLH